MDPALVALAGATRGFMPDDEGLALYGAGLEAAATAAGPLLEIGTYCGKSALYLGAAARAAGSVLFTVDHHRGSEENQPGWEHHDPELVDHVTGRMDTLDEFRRTMEQAGLEEWVVAVVGDSSAVSAHWGAPLSLVFIDGGHGREPAWATTSAGLPTWRWAGCWPFTTCSPTRRTEGGRLTSCGAGPWRREPSPT